MIFWLKYKECKVQRGYVACSVKKPGLETKFRSLFMSITNFLIIGRKQAYRI